MQQASFSDLAYENKKKVTRKEQFLSEMDGIVPWRELLKPIRQHYPTPGNGLHPIPAKGMRRIDGMQQWYGLSDPGMEDSLYDTESLRRFAGVDIDHITDESTILQFRHFLEAHRLTEALFQVMKQYLSKQNLLLREGAIVDASIIRAPRSTKHRDRQRDPAMTSTRKGKSWPVGMTMPVGSDTQGRVHSVVVTDAAVQDSQVMADCLHGEEAVIYGDKATVSAKRQQAAEAQGVTGRVSRKARLGKKLNCADRAFNRKSDRTRARVEHVFGIIKHLWGYRKVRYRGLAKNRAQVFALMALANVYLARRELTVT